MQLSAPCCSNRLVATPRPCPHVRAYKEAGGLDAYQIVQQYVQACKYRVLDPSKGCLPSCFACKTCVGRIHVCLHCIYISCVQGGHLQQHVTEKNHPLSVEASLSVVFCASCGDYVYDSDLDAVVSLERNSALAVMQKAACPSVAPYLDWRPTKAESMLFSRNSRPVAVPAHLLGLRGLFNLGNTCFMNCILQAFIHNPLLRNYFLSDMHDRSTCTARLKNADGVCLGCEMDLLFSQVFSGARTPYNPHHFLYVIWKFANSLAGYEQQDAHEFLITALNGVHAHCGGGSTHDCPCVVHRIFSGSLQSSVTCMKCGIVSTKHDPIFDISLDLPKRDETEDAAAPAGAPKPPLTLAACLHRFTSAERLGTTEKYNCSQCHTAQESTKQLSLQTLPTVICFHLKRFEHSQSGSSSTKISTPVEFPEELDMTPYLATRNVPRGPATSFETYELFAVVNHHGDQVNKGHYTSFVRQAGLGWLRCDDAFITKASLGHVLGSEAYLLFYIKKYLEYEKK